MKPEMHLPPPLTEGGEPCDLLVEAGHVVPIEPHGVALAGHAVAVRAGRILAVLPSAEARARFQPAEHLSRPQSVLMPGLVNAHCHNAMTLLRGMADDLPLMVWLNEHIWPAEARLMSARYVRDGVELAIAEMLRGGTTCTNDNYFFPDVQAERYAHLGFRALVGLPVIDFPTAWAQDADGYFSRAASVHDDWKGHALVRAAFAPHAPYTVSDANFERLRVLADQLDVPVHLHLHETAHEVEESLNLHGQRPIARMDRLGLMNDRLIAVHMTQLTDAEIELCARRGVAVAHCPESNLKLASGFCPAAKLHEAGVTLAIGTDGPASNNDLDMFGEMRTAALLAKAVRANAAALDAPSALHAATLGGAKALGWEEEIGSLEPGKAADMVLVDFSLPEMQPCYDVISHLVYAAGRHQVSDVWIAGAAKLRDRVLVDLDEPALLQGVAEWQRRINDMGVSQ